MDSRVIEIVHKNKIGHLGSCLTALPILEHIYKKKREKDIVVLSSGHAGIALYTD